MNVDDACKLLNDNMIYPPGWQVVAHDATHLHGGEIHVTVKYPGVKTGPQNAVLGYNEENVNFAGFFLTVGKLQSEDELVHEFLTHVAGKIRSHEDRELLRYKNTLRAPFHPHTVDGRQAWGEPETDATFGYPVFVPESATRVDHGLPHGYERLA